MNVSQGDSEVHTISSIRVYYPKVPKNVERFKMYFNFSTNDNNLLTFILDLFLDLLK